MLALLSKQQQDVGPRELEQLEQALTESNSMVRFQHQGDAFQHHQLCSQWRVGHKNAIMHGKEIRARE
jgi:hypothetical protein